MRACQLESISASLTAVAQLAIGDDHLQRRIAPLVRPVVARLARLRLRKNSHDPAFEKLWERVNDGSTLCLGLPPPPEAFPEMVTALTAAWTTFAASASGAIFTVGGDGSDLALTCSQPLCGKVSPSHKSCGRCGLAHCASHRSRQI